MTPGAASRRPSLRVERELQRAGHRLIAGMDEVGRGALAGPVSVGVVVIDEACRSAPVGVKDSKLLSHKMRERMVPRIHRWAAAYAVGHSSPGEIDRYGIMLALRLAGNRALAELCLKPDLILLDGNHDWLTDPARVGLLGLAEEGPGLAPCVPVRTMVKADMFCSSVAAASVLAKVERDATMVALAAEVPDYAWELNKGYCAPEHFAALQSRGPSVHHRRSWRLPGVFGVAGGDPAAPTALPGAVMDDDGAMRTERGGGNEL
jgi:ribonuclease HII